MRFHNQFLSVGSQSDSTEELADEGSDEAPVCDIIDPDGMPRTELGDVDWTRMGMFLPGLFMEGWLGEPGKSPGAWPVGRIGTAGPAIDLTRLPADALTALEERARSCGRESAAEYLELLFPDENVDARPEAVIFFPRDMPLSAYVMQNRPNAADFLCTAWQAYPGWIENSLELVVGVLIVYRLDAFLALPPDGGLLDLARKPLRDIQPGWRWICLADAPDDGWIEAHRVKNPDDIKALLRKSSKELDLRWLEGPRGMALHDIAYRGLRADRSRLERQRNSFRWFPGAFSVSVVSKPTQYFQGIHRVHLCATARTSEVSGLEPEDAALFMDELNAKSCGVAAFAFDPEEQCFVLAASDIVTVPGAETMSDCFALRIALLARDFRDYLPDLAGRFGVGARFTAPLGYHTPLPDDEALNNLERLYEPTCGDWNPYSIDLQNKEIADSLAKSGFRRQAHNNSHRYEHTGVKGSYEIDIALIASSRAGSGVRLTLRALTTASRKIIARRANSLNLCDMGLGWLPLRGAWRSQELPQEGYALIHECFLPSLHYDPSTLCQCVGELLVRFYRIEGVRNETH